MKKLTALLLSLVMCLSLLAIPVQAAFTPDPDDPPVIDVGGDPADPGDENPDDPGNPAQPTRFPEPLEELPVD